MLITNIKKDILVCSLNKIMKNSFKGYQYNENQCKEIRLKTWSKKKNNLQETNNSFEMSTCVDMTMKTLKYVLCKNLINHKLVELMLLCIDGSIQQIIDDSSL